MKNKENWQFERSSGYAGYRNKVTGEWIYEEDYLKLFSPTKEETEQKLYTEEEVLKLLLNLPTFENNLHKDQLINRWFAENKK